MHPVTLLGPQFRAPILRDVLRARGIAGPYVSISAGWQEREGEIDELREHVGAEVEDLLLHARTEEVLAADPPLRAMHRERQAQLTEMQTLYSAQLLHAKSAARELQAQDRARPTVRAALRRAISALRALDRAHLASIAATHEGFERDSRLLERPAVARAFEALRARIAGANAVFVAGGHVAVLANRLRLMGGAALFEGRPLIAWSAGAMVLGEVVVTYHDRPPQGAANAEVFDAGLGLLRRALPLPHASSRLALHDADRVALFARRFAPLACLTLDAGSWAHFERDRLRFASGVFRLGRRGELQDAGHDARE